jgi:pyruvate dehydrogenase E2 component (dihydrolipoamide acetyltransferase)
MDVVMPQLGETVKDGTVTAWRKKVGERVEKDEPLFEVETDKTEMEIPAPAAGVVAAILVPEGETVAVGARLAVIEVPGEARAQAAPAAGADHVAPSAASAPRPPMPARSARRGEGEQRLSPVVRRLLEEHRLDPAAIAGTGAEGRITRDDVLAHIARMQREPVAAGAEGAGGDEVVVPLSRLRKRTAERTARSAAEIPHVLQAVEVDFSAVDAARSAGGDAWKRAEGFSLTYLPFVARAVCDAIRDFPHVNATLRGDSLLVHRRVNLGIAVDLGADVGLLVPVLKDAGDKALRALAVEVHALAAKAKRGALVPDDVAGGTYTLTNNGAFGTLVTAPIILPPQVAILSTDAVRKRAVVVEGPQGDAIVVRPVGILAQCFDHRALDGAYSAAFLRRVREILEGRDWRAELA